MQKRKAARALPAALALVFIAALSAPAQEGEAARPQGAPQPRAEVNHEVHLHLLTTADAAEGAPKTPQSLDAVVRQLRAALPAPEYRLAASFIYRVRDGGALEVRTAGFAAPARAPNAPLAPTSFQLSLSGVKLVDPSATQPFINVQQFRLGMKIPVHAAGAAGDKAGGNPAVYYEDAGVNTMLSVREGEPTLVGTLDGGGPGQFYVIVLTVRRAGR